MSIHIPFRESLGILAETHADGLSEIVLEVGPQHMNAAGVAHGGLIATLLDIAMGTALRSLASEPSYAITIDMQIQYLAPARGRIVTTGKVLRHGARIHFSEAEVRSAAGELLATARGTYLLEPLPPGTTR